MRLLCAAALIAAATGCEAVAGVGDFQVAGGGADASTSAMGGAGSTGGGGVAGGGSSGGGGGGPLDCTGPGDVFVDDASRHCYWLVRESLGWPEAQAACRAIGDGADLASITSEAERNFVDGTIDIDNPIWIGGSDRDSEGTFTWSNGEPWNYAAWGDGQPDNQNGNQHCVRMRDVVGVNNDDFDDNQCFVTFEYLCERGP